MVFNIKQPKQKEEKVYAIEKKESSKTQIPESPQYLVEGYRWFDKTYGNTYHKVIITDLKTGEEVYRSENMEYGYGEQWKQTAYEELVKKGLAKSEDRNNHELNRKRFIYRQNDVDRKKDLP